MIRPRSLQNLFLSGMLALPAQAAPKAFDPAKDIDISLHHGVLSLKVPKEVHLKQRFLKVEAKAGVVTLGELPPASGKDEVGDPVWRGTVHVALHGQDLKDPVELRVTYQPCSEGVGGVCYRPQHHALVVRAADFEPAAK